MLAFRQTVAILVAVAVFTSVAAVPRPEEAKKEADNIIPQVGYDSITHSHNRLLTHLADQGLLALSNYTKIIKSMILVPQININNN
jgi:hypothetical protein